MKGKKIEFKQAESTKELATIRSLAKEIWPPVYSPILSEEQLDYMMEMMYSMPVLHRETEEEGIKYYIVMKDNLPIGFTSFGPYEDGVAKLHKLYLDEKFRGNGFGRQMIEFIADKAREEGGRLLSDAKKQIETEKQNAIREIRGQVAELSGLVAVLIAGAAGVGAEGKLDPLPPGGSHHLFVVGGGQFGLVDDVVREGQVGVVQHAAAGNDGRHQEGAPLRHQADALLVGHGAVLDGGDPRPHRCGDGGGLPQDVPAVCTYGAGTPGGLPVCGAVPPLAGDCRGGPH